MGRDEEHMYEPHDDIDMDSRGRSTYAIGKEKNATKKRMIEKKKYMCISGYTM